MKWMTDARFAHGPRGDLAGLGMGAMWSEEPSAFLTVCVSVERKLRTDVERVPAGLRMGVYFNRS
jgi:hypothetical protein